MSIKTLHKKPSWQNSVVALVSLLGIFILPVTIHASVVSDFIASLSSWTPTAGHDAPERDSFISALNSCLNRDWFEHDGQKNWQYAPAGQSAPTSSSQLSERLGNTSHPCRGSYTNLTSMASAARAPANPPASNPPAQNAVNPPSGAGTTPQNPNPPASGASGGAAPVTNPAANPQPQPGAPQQNAGTQPVVIYGGPKHVDVTAFSSFGAVTIDKIINNVIGYVSGLLAIIAVAALMYGGVMYMTAGGDTAKIAKAKSTLILTFVGLILASMAYLIIVFATRIFYGA